MSAKTVGTVSNARGGDRGGGLPAPWPLSSVPAGLPRRRPAVATAACGPRCFLRFSYMVSFQVDRAGVVLVDDDEDDDGELRARSTCSAYRGGGREDEALGTAAPSVVDRLGRRLSASTSADEASFDDGSVAAGMDAATIVHRRATLVRLNVPRIGIRACSAPAAHLPLPVSGESGEGTNHEQHALGAGWSEEGGGAGPSVSVTAEWLEGYLEMEDPGTIAVPPLPPPSLSTSSPLVPPPRGPMASAVNRREINTDGGVGGVPLSSLPPPPLDKSTCHVAPLNGASKGCPKAYLCVPPSAASAAAAAASEPPASSVSETAATISGPAGEQLTPRSAGDARRPSIQGSPPGEIHRLRWLAVRMLSFKMGEDIAAATARPVPARSRASSAGSGVDAAEERAERDGGADGDRRCSGDGSQVVAVEQDGVSVEGLWAEWSPALFFLAGKSGATVRRSWNAWFVCFCGDGVSVWSASGRRGPGLVGALRFGLGGLLSEGVALGWCWCCMAGLLVN